MQIKATIRYHSTCTVAAKNIINLLSILTIWWCSCVEFLVLWKRGFAMTSAFSWQNSVSLCPVSPCTPRPNLPVTPGISWLPTFAFQSPIMKWHIFWVLVPENCRTIVGLHRTIQLQILQHYWLRYRLGLLWYWVVWLENRDHSIVFEIAPRSCILDFFFLLWWLLHFF